MRNMKRIVLELLFLLFLFAYCRITYLESQVISFDDLILREYVECLFPNKCDISRYGIVNRQVFEVFLDKIETTANTIFSKIEKTRIYEENFLATVGFIKDLIKEYDYDPVSIWILLGQVKKDFLKILHYVSQKRRILLGFYALLSLPLSPSDYSTKVGFYLNVSGDKFMRLLYPCRVKWEEKLIKSYFNPDIVIKPLFLEDFDPRRSYFKAWYWLKPSVLYESYSFSDWQFIKTMEEFLKGHEELRLILNPYEVYPVFKMKILSFKSFVKKLIALSKRRSSLIIAVKPSSFEVFMKGANIGFVVEGVDDLNELRNFVLKYSLNKWGLVYVWDKYEYYLDNVTISFLELAWKFANIYGASYFCIGRSSFMFFNKKPTYIAKKVKEVIFSK